ncbi:MAG: hypothetical protein H6595_13335 [Flavobacteriales bacterium]|nr:hypothetical protein [Flavobacteriales bacterium]MCB9168449.1 hypothetical protein [Flavobacteriales bacterium]
MRTNFRYLGLFAFMALAITACKKDEPEETGPDCSVYHYGTVKINFDLLNGTAPYSLTDQLTDSAGHAVVFDQVRFYVSGIHLADDGGTEVAHFEDKVLLVDAANSSNTYTLGDVNSQHIHMVTFDLGLDSVTNHADPTTAEAPLNDATMHWGWNPAAGYKFLVLEGRVDDDGDGTVDANDPTFVYHVATDALLRSDEVHVHQDLGDCSTLTMMVGVDVAQLAAVTDMLTNNDTHTSNNMDLAIRLMDALVNAIDEE